MLQQWFNWRTGLAGIAMAIVITTIFYSRYLARTIASEERQKVEAWAEAQQFIASASPEENISFASIIMAGQTSIPIIETNERDSITNFHNLDSSKVQRDADYLLSKLSEFRRNNAPIITYFGQQRNTYNKYYYGESLLLKQVRYYPIVQLVIVTLFILLTLIALTTRHRAAQDQLWAGMAKETAHQLGTPLSALQGWLEMMKESPPDTHMLTEMEKDINRLKLVSDRFSKIGSTPHLEEHDLVRTLESVVEYVRKRAPGRVKFTIETGGIAELPVHISPPLFEWVVENLLKNALDAMDGKGDIRITLAQQGQEVMVDISDTGKGISAANIQKVFNPGFTTKKRGWGLGLTLSRRIVEQYHHGRLFVKSAEVGKGTTFRIILNK
jgi:signal transduction histidine kinase